MDNKDSRPRDGASSRPRDQHTPSHSIDPTAIPDTGPPGQPNPGEQRQGSPVNESVRNNNRALIDAYLTGTREHDEFFTNVRAVVKRWGLARFGQPLGELVDEVAQQTYLNAMHSATAYKPIRGSVGGWIFGIVCHVVQSMYKEQADQVARVSSLQATRRDDTDPYASGDRLLDRLAALGEAAASDDAATLADSEWYQFINRITDPDYREVLDLRFRRSLSQREIATEMGISYDNVRQRLHRTLKKLKKIIEIEKLGKSTEEDTDA